MTLDEIKRAVDLGKTVHWHNTGYDIVKSDDRYGVLFKGNDNFTALEDVDGELQGSEDDFFLSDVEKTVYQRFRDAGLVVGSHESDLYVLSCEQSKLILADFETHEKNATGFISQTGEGQCIEIPFAYDPFYEKKIKFTP